MPDEVTQGTTTATTTAAEVPQGTTDATTTAAEITPTVNIVPGNKPSGQSVIDPVNRIEGHLRIDMEVEDGFVTKSWVSGGLFRGMELVLQNRRAADAVYIAQRICGVCPVSHAHSACIAAEKSYGEEDFYKKLPNAGRIIRNIVEGSQFLHSHILWFYNLAALDYVDPIKALDADIADTVELANTALEGLSASDAAAFNLQHFGTTQADFAGIQNRLKAFAANGQLSIFEGNWFDAKNLDGTSAYKLSPELNLIATAHYLEALEMQAIASEISGIVGGKMPHIMSSLPGGTTFVPTEEKLDDVLFRAKRLQAWVTNTMIPDTIAIASAYLEAEGVESDFAYGRTDGNYIAWGVFESPSFKPEERYLPGGVYSLTDSAYSTVKMYDENLITESTVYSFYDAEKQGAEPLQPREGRTFPLYKEEYALGASSMAGREHIGAHPKDKTPYTWDKAPRYDGKPFEAGGLSRLLVAYQRNVPEIKTGIDTVVGALDANGKVSALLDTLGATNPLAALNSTLGRTGARNIETWYVANKLVSWIEDLIEAIKGGDAASLATFAESANKTGEGSGMWEAPRGAIYHYMKLDNDIIQKYQIIIPSSWNISPRDESGAQGPMEKAMLGQPVEDVEKPIHALRAVHSFDPCIACAVHVSEPKTGKKFATVTSPWGVR